MVEKPKPENIAKLNPKQLKVYQNWAAERAQTQPLFEQALAAVMINDHATAKACYEKIGAIVPSICEHGHSIWDDCVACIEIERILYPEAFNEDGIRLDEVEAEHNKTLN